MSYTERYVILIPQTVQNNQIVISLMTKSGTGDNSALSIKNWWHPNTDIAALQVGLKNIGNRADVTSVPQAGGTINADMIKYKSAAKK